MPTSSFRKLRNRFIDAISPTSASAAATAAAREDNDVEQEEEEEEEGVEVEEDNAMEGGSEAGDLKSAEEANSDEEEEEDTPTTSSPSRVILDLIDCTCHEIITLGGDMNNSTDDNNDNDVEVEFVMPSFESYVALAQRLNYYMDLLIQGYPDAEQPKLVLEQGTDIWFRFVMAKWIIDVFTKVAYPDDYVDVIRNGRKEPRPPALMDTLPTGWTKMQQEFAELSSMLDGRGGPDMDWKRVQSLECAMEGLEALAKLKSQLRDILEEIESGGKKKKSVAAFNFGRVIKYDAQYRAASDKITNRLQKCGSAEYYANLFIPLDRFQSDINAEQRPSTIAGWEHAINAILEDIEEAITHAEFPLNQFKIEFLDILKDWETSYLPQPALFKVGYFKYAEGDAPGAERSHRSRDNGGGKSSGGKRVRKEPNRFTPSTPTKKSAASSPAKSRSPIKKRTRRGCRVPFTEVEKECLLKGVQKFGVGHWAEILHHFQDVFEVAGRNNVDLKDLYRNLSKAT